MAQLVYPEICFQEISRERVLEKVKARVTRGEDYSVKDIYDKHQWVNWIVGCTLAGRTKDISTAMRGAPREATLHAIVEAYHLLLGSTVYDIDPKLSEAFSRTSIKGVSFGELGVLGERSTLTYLHGQGHLGMEGCFVVPFKEGVILRFVSRDLSKVDTEEEYVMSGAFIAGKMHSSRNISDALPKGKYKQIELDRIQWAICTLLYIHWSNPGENWILEPEARKLWNRMRREKSPKKRKRISQQLKSTPCHQRKRVIDRSAPVYPKRETGTGRKLTKRSWVWGYWRRPPNYATRESYELVWVRPFWRGEGEETQSSRISVTSTAVKRR